MSTMDDMTAAIKAFCRILSLFSSSQKRLSPQAKQIEEMMCDSASTFVIMA